MAKTQTEHHKFTGEYTFGDYTFTRPASKTDVPANDGKSQSKTEDYFKTVFNRACSDLEQRHKLEIESWQARFVQAIAEKEAIYSILMSGKASLEDMRAAAELIHTDSRSTVSAIKAAHAKGETASINA